MDAILPYVPLTGYVSAITFLLYLISPSFRAPSTGLSNLHLGYGVLALLTTWTYMLLFFQRSYTDAAALHGLGQAYSAAQWLRDTSLFDQAWTYVCETPLRWWFSEQLCIWTVGPFTVMLAVESQRKGIARPWAYMLLGQLVAISFAQSLFFAALALAPSPPSTKKSTSEPATPESASALLVLCTFTALATVALIPYVLHTPYFLPVLLLMHALCLLPLFTRSTSPTSGLLSVPILYSLLGFFTLLLRLSNYASLLNLKEDISIVLICRAFLALPSPLIETLFSHPAQSSISFDTILATLGFTLWMMIDVLGRKTNDVSRLGLFMAGLVVRIPVVGVASISGLYLAEREEWVGNTTLKLDDVKEVREKGGKME